MNEFGYQEGSVCWRNGCQGVIALYPRTKDCSCHIAPPCSGCMESREFCPECDWTAEEEERSFQFNESRCIAISKDDAKLGMYGETPLKRWEPRPLDPRKIDYRILSHSNSSQICEGIYPEGTELSEVLKLVKGTFGGRFEQFGNGKFRYIAYTD